MRTLPAGGANTGAVLGQRRPWGCAKIYQFGPNFVEVMGGPLGPPAEAWQSAGPARRRAPPRAAAAVARAWGRGPAHTRACATATFTVFSGVGCKFALCLLEL